MAGSRGDSAGVLGIGAAVAAAYIWFRYPVLLVAGGLLALGGAVSLAADLRRGRSWHEQDVMLRKLWTAAKRADPARAGSASSRAPGALRHGPRWPTVPQRERQPDPALNLLARVAKGPGPGAEAGAARYTAPAAALRPAPLWGHLAAQLRCSRHRGGRMGRPQRGGADARLRKVRGGAGGRLDQPDGRCAAPTEWPVIGSEFCRQPNSGFESEGEMYERHRGPRRMNSQTAGQARHSLAARIRCRQDRPGNGGAPPLGSQAPLGLDATDLADAHRTRRMAAGGYR